MEANGVNVFKILTFGPIRKQQNLTLDQLGIVRKFKGGMNLKLTSFEKPNAKGSLVHTLVVTSCVGSTKGSSEYIVLKGASYMKNLYMSTPGNNINNVNSDK